MAVAIDRDSESKLYDSITAYLEGEGDIDRVNVFWRMHEFESVEKPRLGEISTKVRHLMEEEYADADEGGKDEVLYEVQDLLEQYYFESELDNY